MQPLTVQVSYERVIIIMQSKNSNGRQLRQRVDFNLCVPHFSHQERLRGRWVVCCRACLLPKHSVGVVRV